MKESGKLIKYKNSEIQIEAKTETKLNRQQVRIINYQWAQHHLTYFFGLVEEWNSEKIQLYRNSEPEILICLCQVKFASLKYLSLGFNEIESIQVISRMYMPEMTDLYLNDNKIWNISNIRKCNWSQFRMLNICNNNIREGRPLEEMKLTNFSEFCVEDDEYDQNQLPDLAFIAKLNIEELQFQNLRLWKENRIQQPVVQDILTSKYIYLSF